MNLSSETPVSSLCLQMRRIPLHGGMAAAAKPAKRRKVVDRRASKGRKLRYHVQQPLVNFCAPVDMEVPAWAEKVFGQLFASKE